jgi:hypothetical protein
MTQICERPCESCRDEGQGEEDQVEADDEQQIEEVEASGGDVIGVGIVLTVTA